MQLKGSKQGSKKTQRIREDGKADPQKSAKSLWSYGKGVWTIEEFEED